MLLNRRATVPQRGGSLLEPPTELDGEELTRCTRAGCGVAASGTQPSAARAGACLLTGELQRCDPVGGSP